MAVKPRTGAPMIDEAAEPVNSEHSSVNPGRGIVASLPWSISAGGARIEGDLGDPDGTTAVGLALAAALADFRRSLRYRVATDDMSEATVAIYAAGVERFIAYAADQGMPAIVESIRREHIEAFLVALRDAGRRPSTVHTYYRGLRAFFAWAVDEDILDRSPMAKVKPPQIPEIPVPILRDEQVDALLKTVVGKDFESRRDAAIISLFLDTGMRRAELTGLTLEHFDRDHQVAIVEGKAAGSGKRVRAVPYSDWAAKAIDRYLRSARPKHPAARRTSALWLGHKGPLTTDGIRQMLERRGRQAGIESLHAHQFRHTFAHKWKAGEGSEQGLMQIAGWKSSAMLRRYGASAASERAQAEHGRLNLWGGRR